MGDEQQLGTEMTNSADINEGERVNVSQGLLGNIPVSISVELGRTKLKIGELMALNQGSVVALDSLAGEPLDLRVNDTLVAKGEIVLIDQHYGIKLTQIVPSADRVYIQLWIANPQRNGRSMLSVA